MPRRRPTSRLTRDRARKLRREADLHSRGFNIFRVSNDDVLRDLETVLTAVVREAGLDAAAWRDGKLADPNK